MVMYFLILPLLSALLLYGSYLLNRRVSRSDHASAWSDAVWWCCAYFVSGALNFGLSVVGL